MITVIIAGGSGTRLWPLSTPDYPKHLLKINGDTRSLLQNTYDRAKTIGDNVYVVPEISHAHHVREQLPELGEDKFIVEPARRGTASCIVAALSHLSDKEDPDEPIAIVSADHYIRDVTGFQHSFKIAADVSTQESRIVLVGVEPNYPATGLGYIQKGEVFDEKTFVFNVHSFKEKPGYEIAQEYVKSGNYLWNCSYFIGSLNTFKLAMQQFTPDLLTNYESLRSATTADAYEKAYLEFENTSIDYALIEKMTDLMVVPASFDWMDVGSYLDLHKVVESDELGNHVHGDKVELAEVQNSFIHNYEDKPVAIIGLDNVVVINTKHGILIARKDLPQKVGEVSKRFSKS